MDPAALPRLLDPGGGVALIALGPFAQQVLTWFVIWVGALGLLHVVLALMKGRLPVMMFCLLGAFASTGAGLFVLWPVLRDHAERSLSSALLWGPLFALGLFVTGALGSAAWAATTQSLLRLLSGGKGQPKEGE